MSTIPVPEDNTESRVKSSKLGSGAGFGASWKVGLLAVLLVAALVLAFDPLRDWVITLAETMRAAGPMGLAVYGLIYVTASLLLMPVALLSMAAGFAYGPMSMVAPAMPST